MSTFVHKSDGGSDDLSPLTEVHMRVCNCVADSNFSSRPYIVFWSSARCDSSSATSVYKDRRIAVTPGSLKNCYL